MVRVFGREIRIPFLNKSDPEPQGWLGRLNNYVLETQKNLRPVISVNEQTGGDSFRLPFRPIQNPMLYDVALYSDTLRTVHIALKREVFRNGIECKEKFICKCTDCDKEFQHTDDDMVCDACGGPLRTPDINQKLRAEKWQDKANSNNQTLTEVLMQGEDDVNIVDDQFFLLVKEYSYNPDGVIFAGTLKEIVRIDPRSSDMRIVVDKTGRPGYSENGKKILTCPEHRTNTYSGVERCPSCNKVLYEVHYRSSAYGGGTNAIHYIDGEIVHASKYSPSFTFGFPPVLTVWMKVTTLLNMDKYVVDYYGRGRPPQSLTFINTSNAASVEAMWEKAKLEKQVNPHNPSLIPVENTTKTGRMVEHVEFMKPLIEMQYIESRKELRQVIGGVYGVMPLLQADVAQSGGLNNEGLQITVTNRAVQMAHEMYNTKVLPLFAKAMGLEDYELVLSPVEVKDEMSELQLEAQRIQNASQMKGLGFEVKMNEEGEFEFEQADATNQPLTPTAASSSPLPPLVGDVNPEGHPGSMTKSDRVFIKNAALKGGGYWKKAKVKKADAPVATTTPAAYNPLYSKPERKIAKGLLAIAKAESQERKGFVLKAELNEDHLLPLARALFRRKFDGITKPRSDRIKDYILDAVVERKPLANITDEIQKINPETTQEEADRIARTETHELKNTARVETFKAEDPEGTDKYKWLGPEDNRTTAICKSITKKTAAGVPLEALKAIIKKEGGETARDWSPHPNCRHVPVKVV